MVPQHLVLSRLVSDRGALRPTFASVSKDGLLKGPEALAKGRMLKLLETVGFRRSFAKDEHFGDDLCMPLDFV